MDNLAIWKAVEKTDPAATKPFTRAGGFSGTAIDPMHLVKKATEMFGPVGQGWGFEEVEHLVGDGAWFSKVRLWYVRGDEKAEVEQWGGTVLTGTRKDGTPYTDEDAPKKSVTDALTKCLSYLGFAADVHMGRYDDVKYVAELRKEFNAGEPTSEESVGAGANLPAIEGVRYERVSAEGRVFTLAKGKTYGKNEALKAAGFRWEPGKRVWFREAA